jgi:epoxyqueuosine reductase
MFFEEEEEELGISFDCRRFTLEPAHGPRRKEGKPTQRRPMSANISNRWNMELRRWLDEASRAAGFSVVGVVEVCVPDDPAAVQDAARFKAWVDAGHAGEMDYLKRRDESGTLIRSSLRVAMPWARSAIVCAMNYNSAIPFVRSEDQLARAAAPLSIDSAPPGSGWIARYAWSGRTLHDGTSAATDYHDELLARLRAIESALLVRAACTTRCTVDTGPFVERSLAAKAGVGWIGKNTCLINQQLGSWLLLAVLITDLPVELTEDVNEQEKAREVDDARAASTPNKLTAILSSTLLSSGNCGTCKRCIDACPTGALLGSKSPDAPRTMDASRCIAYLTIEKKGAIDPSLRAPMGRQVFGCDICQDVCPWNRKSLRKPGTPSIAHVAMGGRSPCTPSIPRSLRNGWKSMQPRPELVNPALDWLAAMDAREFKRRFKGSPLERTGRKRLLRNVAIAMGNSGEARFLPQLEAWASGDDPVLADAAQWARQRLLSDPAPSADVC